MADTIWTRLAPGLTGLVREHVSMGLVVLDDERNVVASNRGFRALLGTEMSPDGTPFESLVEPSRRSAIPDDAEIPVLDARPERRWGGRMEPLTRALSFVGSPGGGRTLPCAFAMVDGIVVVMIEPGGHDRTTAQTVARLNEQLAIARESLEKRDEELARLRDRLDRQRDTDALTGLVSRGALMTRGQEQHELTSRGKLALSALLLDLEGFKRINVEHGLAAGDRVLVTAAAVLRESTREIDLVGRWGGAEFLVLLPATDGDAARGVAGRFRDRIAERVDEELGEPLAIRAGIAERGEGEELDGLLRRTGQALLEAKRGGTWVVLADEPG